MSAGFRELADGILPELRRSRMIINYETIGRSDDQIQEQYNADATKLSVDELLYAASLEDNPDKQESVYKTTAKVYPNDYRAYNNIAAIEFEKGNIDKAKEYLSKAANINGKAAETNANMALVALQQGEVATAETYMSKADLSGGYEKLIGSVALAKGDYISAERNLSGIDCNTTALAQILNKNYSGATATLNAIKNKDAMTDYLQAVLSARQGNKNDAATFLKSAIQKDPSLASYANNDIELSGISK